MSTRKTPKTAEKSLTKRDTANLAKKVTAVSDSTKSLSKEIKSMAKVFSDNQKVLLSMKGMIDTLIDTLEQIQKQSKQLNLIEEDNQRLYAGLNQVRAQASTITSVGEHASKLQEQVNKLVQAQKDTPAPEEIMRAVSDSQNSIQNNTHMIIKIAQRIDTIKDDLVDISSKADKTSNIESELDTIKEKLLTLFTNSSKSSLESEVTQLKASLTSLQNELVTNMAKTESITRLSGEIAKIESEIGSLVKRADSTAFVGEGVKSVQSDLASFKEHILGKTNTIDQKVSSISELLKRADNASSEFHKKADHLVQEMQHVKSAATKSSSTSSKEVIALLKLSEFQSNIRILSESKYGEIIDIEKMAEQTSDIVNLFDKVAIESQDKVSLPQEVRKWAISKMLDCADKWEIRFSDLFNVLITKLGKELVKENIRINQVRDIFGIRGVDEIRKELGIS
ncbi:MAG: chemotaxis protein [Thaumarchaeota archaeon]|nr:chemotaxis protein [Nitrososphaerota archaeon]